MHSVHTGKDRLESDKTEESQNDARNMEKHDVDVMMDGDRESIVDEWEETPGWERKLTGRVSEENRDSKSSEDRRTTGRERKVSKRMV